MENEEDEEYHSCLPTFFTGLITGAAMLGVAVFATMNKTIEPVIPTNEKSSIVVSHDFNKDGLEDLVLHNGTIQIRNRDGSYISLGQMRDNEINEIYKKYRLRKEQVRNPVDNLDYKMNTGRYIAGVSK